MDSEASLLVVEQQLKSLEIAHSAIRESDAPYTGQLCAVGVEPLRDRSRVRKIVSSLPLLR